MDFLMSKPTVKAYTKEDVTMDVLTDGVFRV
jgi:hypothetical protein